MSEKKTCILIYTIYEDVWQAVKKLQAQKINMAAVSVVGNANPQEEQIVGLRTNDRYKNLTAMQAAFWQNMLGILDGELFFVDPEFDSLSAVGAIVPLLVKKNDDVDILGQFGVLAAALFSMGVPENSVRQYEAEINAGNILLIVNSKPTEVERSCEILHSEMQQATVHLA